MKLTDQWFDARFIGRIADDGRSFHVQDSSIDVAQGVLLLCPCRYGKDEPHTLQIPFDNPRNAPPCPANFGPWNRDKTTRPRWTMTGNSLDDLTLTPSVDVGETSCWHGHITNEEVQ